MPRPVNPSHVTFDFDTRSVVSTRCNQTHEAPTPSTVTSLVGFLKACQTVHAN